MMDQIKALLELVSLFSSFVLAICAILALKQINISKKAIEIRSRREASSESANRCQYFNDCLSPLIKLIHDKHTEEKIPIYKDDIDIDKICMYLRKWGKKLNESNLTLNHSDLANSLESFSLFFVNGIADEKIAFFPLSQVYIDAVKIVLPIIISSKVEDEKLFTNTLSLYKNWKNRIERYQLSKEIEKNVSQLKSIDVKKFNIL